jgi:hypothetical protein
VIHQEDRALLTDGGVAIEVIIIGHAGAASVWNG